MNTPGLDVDLTVRVERMDEGPPLVIEQAQLLAYDFFTTDDSSVGPKAYDQQVGKTDPNRITTADVVAINTTMRARSPHTAWERLTSQLEPQPWLQAIPIDASLFGLDDPSWAELRASVEAALEVSVGPYRNLSVATKVLHLKRPNLFPVLDSLVLQQLGGMGPKPMRAMDHLRSQGLANLDALAGIQAALERLRMPDTGEPIIRSRVRILDALLWSSHPSAGLANKLNHWEHAFRRQLGGR